MSSGSELRVSAKVNTSAAFCGLRLSAATMPGSYQLLPRTMRPSPTRELCTTTALPFVMISSSSLSSPLGAPAPALAMIRPFAPRPTSAFATPGRVHVNQSVHLRRLQHLLGPECKLAQLVIGSLAIGISLVDLHVRDLRNLRQWFQHLLAGEPRIAAQAVTEQIHPVLADTWKGTRTNHQLHTRQSAPTIPG